MFFTNFFKKIFLNNVVKGLDKWKANWLNFERLFTIFILSTLFLKKLLSVLFSIFSNNSYAPSIDCDAPWANDGEKAKKASPIRWILLLLISKKSWLTNTGYIFKSLTLSKNSLFKCGTFSKIFLIKLSS